MSVVPNVVSDSPPSSAASMRLDSAPASSGSSHDVTTTTTTTTTALSNNKAAYYSAYNEESAVLPRNAEEKAHWDEVCRAYRQYAAFAVKQFAWNHPARIANLHASQQAVLPRHLVCGTPEFDQMAREYKDAAIRNQFFLDCILRHAGKPHSQQLKDSQQLSTDISKVSSVLKSLARDWSSAGCAERAMAYTPILQSLDAYVTITPSSSNGRDGPRKVCVPGAGVGRLACEIAAKGYSVQGNEFSLHMLLASDFVLNGLLGSGMAISPWLMETRNIVSSLDPLRKVTIPDVDPYRLVGGDSDTTAEFSMAAGDFNSIYSTDAEASAWDAVAASFFIDACDNSIKSLQVIYHMLKPGGCLISFGPLHWHWSGPSMGLADESVEAYRQRWKHLDQRYVESVDLSWEDVQVILKNIGFEMLHVNRNQKAYYTADTRSMLLTEYRCVHFVARKPPAPVPPRPAPPTLPKK